MSDATVNAEFLIRAALVCGMATHFYNSLNLASACRVLAVLMKMPLDECIDSGAELGIPKRCDILVSGASRTLRKMNKKGTFSNGCRVVPLYEERPSHTSLGPSEPPEHPKLFPEPSHPTHVVLNAVVHGHFKTQVSDCLYLIKQNRPNDDI